VHLTRVFTYKIRTTLEGGEMDNPKVGEKIRKRGKAKDRY
jgi:hypothetical protein